MVGRRGTFLPPPWGEGRGEGKGDSTLSGNIPPGWMAVFSLVMLLLISAAPVRAATNDLTTVLQQGLFEEEANRNLDAAIAAYQQLVTRFDKDRQVAATAVFRLGECYRKLGKTNEAIVQYQRIVREFPDQPTLATLSSQNLVGLGVTLNRSDSGVGEGGGAVAGAESLRVQAAQLEALLATIESLPETNRAASLPGLLPEGDSELGTLLVQKTLLEKRLEEFQSQYTPEHPQVLAVRKQIKALEGKIQQRVNVIVLGLRTKLNGYHLALAQPSPTGNAAQALSPAARAEQRKLLEEEIQLVQKDLDEQRKMAEVGRASAADTRATQRDLLELKRQLVALSDEPEIAANASKASTVVTDQEEEAIRRIQAMIKNSPDLINAAQGDEGTPLYQAALKGQLRVASFLLDHGARVNATSRGFGGKWGIGWTPLMAAAYAGHKTMIELLLKNGAGVNVATVSSGNSTLAGYSSLHFAADRGFVAVAKILLSVKPDLNRRNGEGCTALQLAVRNGNIQLVNLLLSSGADPNVSADGGNAPLRDAAMRGHRAIATALLDAGADLKATNKAKETALYAASGNGHLEMVNLLLDRGATVDARDAEGITPLLKAVSKDHTDVVATLLDHKADPDVVAAGTYPLAWACNAGARELAEVLLKHGANPNFNPMVGNKPIGTPLSFAIIRQHEELVGLLLKYKADPNQRTSPDALTPLHLAISQPGIVKLLLEAGANPNVRLMEQIDSGQTPLLLAVGKGDRESAELLLRHDADPNLAYLESGMTPLQMAVRNGNAAMVELLLKYKADPNQRDKAGQTALDYAKPESNRLSALRPGARPLAAPVRLTPNGPVLQSARTENTSVSSASIPELLHQHGARDDLPDFNRIELRRSEINYTGAAFARGSNDWNHYNLLELAAEEYSVVSGSPVWNSNTRWTFNWSQARLRQRTSRRFGTRDYSLVHGGPSTGVPFPDLSRLVIRRADPSDQSWREIPVNLIELLKSGKCDQIPALQWGDVVDVPEADHLANAAWGGLDRETLLAFQKCLTRHVELVINGQTNATTLTPHVESIDWIVNTPYSLVPVLHHSGLLRASSDLSRVKVTRHDRSTGKTLRYEFNCSAEPPDFWLHDGDVVEVPEKP